MTAIKRIMRTATTTLVAAVCLAMGRMAEAQTEKPLELAEGGTTTYSIVIGADAPAFVVEAAKELAYFLKEMTGAEFPVRQDDAPASEFEIVLGETNRKSLRDAPSALLPKEREGFVILPEKDKLYIMGGRIPRGTLYGVYDFLEQELGVRFLAPEANHVLRRKTLKIRVKPRFYDPVFEYRGHFPPNNARTGYGEWSSRSRINSAAQGYGSVRRLGGGRAMCHSFAVLVPVGEYFEKNPEMFALIDGKRTSATLCLTNPDTLRVATEKARSWAQLAGDDPGKLNIVQISQNDSAAYCRCANCAAVDEEEGAPMTGQLIRFVNAIAREIGREFPNVYVETMAYVTSTFPPRKTRPADNVIIFFAPIGLDLGRPLNEQPKYWDALQGWRSLNNHIYIWDYPQGFHDFLAPFPSLWPVARNIQLFAENGIKGYIPQQPMNDGTEMRYLRNYTFAQLQWRPERDYREVAEEFCRLYYGRRSGPEIMKYIDLLHDSFAPLVRDGRRLSRHGSFKDDAFVPAADRILARASALAESEEQRERIAEFRLPIWRLMLIQAFGRHGKVLSLPEQWWYRPGGEDADDAQDFGAATDFGGWQQVRIPIVPASEYYRRSGHGSGWYGVHFDMPDTGGEQLALHFESMDGTWDVYVDGQEVAKEMPSGLGLYREKEVPYVLLPEGLTPGRHTIAVRVKNGSGFYKLQQHFNPDFTTADPVTIVDMSQPLPPELRAAAEGFLSASSKAGMVRITYGYGPTPTPYLEDLLRPKVNLLLIHGGPRSRPRISTPARKL